MATERKTGLGSLPTGLLRPTTPPEPAFTLEPSGGLEDDGSGDQGEGQGRGENSAESRAPARARRKRAPVSTKTTGRKLHLPDDIHDRLWLLARQRRQTVSAVAAELLDRALPRFSVTREG